MVWLTCTFVSLDVCSLSQYLTTRHLVDTDRDSFVLTLSGHSTQPIALLTEKDLFGRVKSKLMRINLPGFYNTSGFDNLILYTNRYIIFHNDNTTTKQS